MTAPAIQPPVTDGDPIIRLRGVTKTYGAGETAVERKTAQSGKRAR